MRVELPLVHDVGRLLAVLGDDVLDGEARRGEPQLLEGVLLERGQLVGLPLVLIRCTEKGFSIRLLITAPPRKKKPISCGQSAE